MSLVAYGNSSDEESDEYDSSEEKQQEAKPSTSRSVATLDNQLNDSSTLALKLPSPKKHTAAIEEDELKDSSTLALKLPSPKRHTAVIEEDDDEFLHKKAVPTLQPPPKPSNKRGPVQITIPALQKKDEPTKVNKRIIGAEPNKPAGLLNLLPKPSFGHLDKKKPANIAVDAKTASTTTSSKGMNGFVPHSVKKAAAAATTMKKATQKPLTNQVDENNSDGESSDHDDDFFSFHSETRLPEVSQQEINAMVAKKTADMKTATTTYLQSMERQQVETVVPEEIDDVSTQSRIDNEAITALCGAKRARRGDVPSVIIELTGDQVLPNRDEWLRNQLQHTTEYQPRGLVDEEPAAGTRKKHQITYLAHQAKANEQELQAMWAANRHTRRQTQSKYGF